MSSTASMSSSNPSATSASLLAPEKSSKFVRKLGKEISKISDRDWRAHFVDYSRLRRQIKKIAYYEQQEKGKENSRSPPLQQPQQQANSNPSNPTAMHTSQENEAPNSSAVSSQQASFQSGAPDSGHAKQCHEAFWVILKSEIDKVNTFFLHKLEDCTRAMDELKLEQTTAVGASTASMSVESSPSPSISSGPASATSPTPRSRESSSSASSPAVSTSSEAERASSASVAAVSSSASPMAASNDRILFGRVLREHHPDIAERLLDREILEFLRASSGNTNVADTDQEQYQQFKRFLVLCEQLDWLRKFVILNYVILLKICKKYDRNTDQTSQKACVPLSEEPFYTSTKLEGLLTRAENITNRYIKRRGGRESNACAICQQVVSKPVILACDHKFCFPCLSRHPCFGESCPVCRAQQELDPQQLAMDSMLFRFSTVSLEGKIAQTQTQGNFHGMDTDMSTASASASVSAASTPNTTTTSLRRSSLPSTTSSASSNSNNSSLVGSPVVQLSQLPNSPSASATSTQSPSSPGLSPASTTHGDSSESTKPASLHPPASSGVSLHSSDESQEDSDARGVQRVSCHQCKTTKESHHLLFCTTQADKARRKRKCRKKYCNACLRRSYNQNVAAMSQTEKEHWVCPACHDVCSCAACQRRTNEVRTLKRPMEAIAATAASPAATTLSPTAHMSTLTQPFAHAIGHPSQPWAIMPPHPMALPYMSPPLSHHHAAFPPPPSNPNASGGGHSHTHSSHTRHHGSTSSLPGSVSDFQSDAYHSDTGGESSAMESDFDGDTDTDANVNVPGGSRIQQRLGKRILPLNVPPEFFFSSPTPLDSLSNTDSSASPSQSPRLDSPLTSARSARMHAPPLHTPSSRSTAFHGHSGPQTPLDRANAMRPRIMLQAAAASQSSNRGSITTPPASMSAPLTNMPQGFGSPTSAVSHLSHAQLAGVAGGGSGSASGSAASSGANTPSSSAHSLLHSLPASFAALPAPLQQQFFSIPPALSAAQSTQRADIVKSLAETLAQTVMMEVARGNLTRESVYDTVNQAFSSISSIHGGNMQNANSAGDANLPPSGPSATAANQQQQALFASDSETAKKMDSESTAPNSQLATTSGTGSGNGGVLVAQPKPIAAAQAQLPDQAPPSARGGSMYGQSPSSTTSGEQAKGHTAAGGMSSAIPPQLTPFQPMSSASAAAPSAVPPFLPTVAQASYSQQPLSAMSVQYSSAADRDVHFQLQQQIQTLTQMLPADTSTMPPAMLVHYQQELHRLQNQIAILQQQAANNNQRLSSLTGGIATSGNTTTAIKDVNDKSTNSSGHSHMSASPPLLTGPMSMPIAGAQSEQNNSFGRMSNSTSAVRLPFFPDMAMQMVQSQAHGQPQPLLQQNFRPTPNNLPFQNLNSVSMPPGLPVNALNQGFFDGPFNQMPLNVGMNGPFDLQLPSQSGPGGMQMAMAMPMAMPFPATGVLANLSSAVDKTLSGQPDLSMNLNLGSAQSMSGLSAGESSAAQFSSLLQMDQSHTHGHHHAQPTREQ